MFRQNPQVRRPSSNGAVILDCASCSPESPSFAPATKPRQRAARSRQPNPRGPIFWARAVQICLLCLVTIAMIGATRSQYDRVGNQLMCACGCGQILLECNHVGCPDSPVMIRELHTQVAGGGPDKSIFDWFVAKYGPIILAAPIRGGFDRVAWIVPIAVFLLATMGTFGVVWLWKRRALQFAVPATAVPQLLPATPQQAALRNRIRQETEY
jgi:cytochrome c-type biogenesis protein CcmH/NrfF